MASKTVFQRVQGRVLQLGRTDLRKIIITSHKSKVQPSVDIYMRPESLKTLTCSRTKYLTASDWFSLLIRSTLWLAVCHLEVTVILQLSDPQCISVKAVVVSQQSVILKMFWTVYYWHDKYEWTWRMYKNVFHCWENRNVQRLRGKDGICDFK